MRCRNYLVSLLVLTFFVQSGGSDASAEPPLAKVLAEQKALFPPSLHYHLENSHIGSVLAPGSGPRWRFDDAWLRVSQSGGQEWLGTAGVPGEDARLLEGFPSLPARKGELREAGAALLWDVHSLFWSQEYFLLQGELRHYESNGEVRKAFFRNVRHYQRRRRAKATHQVFFRELLEFSAPAVLKGYAFLSFHLFGGSPDLIWIRSPFGTGAREVGEANLADPLLGSSLSLGDILTWSGTPGRVAVRDLKKLSLYVPFAEVPTLHLTREGTCLNSTASYESGRRVLEFDSSAVGILGFPWLPQNLKLFQREVYRVELVNRALFHPHGKEVLYIDRNSRLPVLKESYSLEGELQKTVFSLFALGSEREGVRRRVVPLATVALGRDGSEESVFIYETSKRCKRLPRALNGLSYDPREL